MKTQVNDEGPAVGGRQLEEGYKLNEAGELVPDYDHTIKYFEDGDIVKGEVVRVDRDEVLIDVGYKSEGVVPLKELSIRRNVDPHEVVEIGKEIEVFVLQKEDADGRLILSKKRAEFEKSWDRIEQAHRDKEPVNGYVIEVVKGGLILDIGVRGFLPASLVDINRVKDLNEFIGQELECKIIELNRSRNNVVLSRKAILQGEKQNEKSEIIGKITTGQIVKGKISSIVDFGAFVDLGGIDGLIHISELSWSHIDHPSEVVSVGQEVSVQVLDVDKTKARVSLGLKQTQEDSWKKTVDGLKVDTFFNAKVIRILPFGVFVQFENSLEGLIHISELSHSRVENPHKVVAVGDEIEVKLINIDEERRRISLSLKQATEAPEDTDEETPAEESAEPAEEAKTEETSAEAIDAPEIEEKLSEEEPAEAVEEHAEAKVEETRKTPEEAVEDQAKEAVEDAIEQKAKEVVKAAEAIKSEEAQIKSDVSEEEASDNNLDKKEEKKKIKIKPAEEKLKEELERESVEEEKKKKELEALDSGLEETGSAKAEDDSDKLEDILNQMKKSHGEKQ